MIMAEFGRAPHHYGGSIGDSRSPDVQAFWQKPQSPPKRWPRMAVRAPQSYSNVNGNRENGLREYDHHPHQMQHRLRLECHPPEAQEQDQRHAHNPHRRESHSIYDAQFADSMHDSNSAIASRNYPTGTTMHSKIPTQWEHHGRFQQHDNVVSKDATLLRNQSQAFRWVGYTQRSEPHDIAPDTSWVRGIRHESAASFDTKEASLGARSAQLIANPFFPGTFGSSEQLMRHPPPTWKGHRSDKRPAPELTKHGSPKSADELSNSAGANTAAKHGSGESLCLGKCESFLRPHAEVFFSLTKGSGADEKANFSKQNAFLLDVLFDEIGELRYHSECVRRLFEISKGRLKRLSDRKIRVARGEAQGSHALQGRPSNNRKRPETLKQFIEFVRNQLTMNESDSASTGPEYKYRLPPEIRRIQGNEMTSLRMRFNLHQQSCSTAENARETISSGTAQAWFKVHFSDTMPPVSSNVSRLNAAQASPMIQMTPGTSQHSPTVIKRALSTQSCDSLPISDNSKRMKTIEEPNVFLSAESLVALDLANQANDKASSVASAQFKQHDSSTLKCDGVTPAQLSVTKNQPDHGALAAIGLTVLASAASLGAIAQQHIGSRSSVGKQNSEEQQENEQDCEVRRTFRIGSPDLD